MWSILDPHNMLETYSGVGHVDLTLHRIVRRAVIQSHRLHKPHLRPAIIVIRDPRDAYTSFYHFVNNYEHRAQHSWMEPHYVHDPELPLQEDFYRFLQAKLLHRSSPWFTYREFLESWQGQRDTHFVRYEDCLVDTAGTLTSILVALGRAVDPVQVASAVAQNTFEAFTRQHYGQSRRPGETSNRHFVRKGVAGDWKNHFNRSAAELLEDIDGTTLREFGYESDGSWIDSHFATNSS